MNTLHAHFQHYYKNLGFVGVLAGFYHKPTKLQQAYYFGLLKQKVASMQTPREFVFLHKKLPPFSTLPDESQKHIEELQRFHKDVQDYFFQPTGSEERFLELVEKCSEKEIMEIIEKAHELLTAFYTKLEELSDFKETYE